MALLYVVEMKLDKSILYIDNSPFGWLMNKAVLFNKNRIYMRKYKSYPQKRKNPRMRTKLAKAAFGCKYSLFGVNGDG